MSKSLKKIENDQKSLSILGPILEKQLQRQDEQGRALTTMFEGIKSMYSEFSEGMAAMKDMVQEVRDSVTLNNAECYMIQVEVARKSNKLAKDRYHDEDVDFNKIVGRYRRMIWKQLKFKYDVPKYNCIRRIDFEESVKFVKDFRPENYI